MMDGDPRHAIVGMIGPEQRKWPAVARQQGGMHVDGAERRQMQ